MNITQEIQKLITRLESSDTEIRQEAALELAQIGSEDAVKPLLSYLNDPVSDVREKVIYALGQTKDEKAVPALVNCLEDPSLEIRWVTVEALGEIGSQQALAALISCLEKEQMWNVRSSAIKALAKISSETEVIRTIINTLQHDENLFVRREAAYALSQKTVAKVNRLLPDLDWHELINNLKQIAKTFPNPRQRLNQAWELLCELAEFSPEPMRLPVAEMSAGTDKGEDEPEKIKDELYELADELMEQLTEFLESSP